ncbi:MAG: tRNA (adenosine(37)-N6)-threonylcarbamoyltransferase complex ATPase subunit type 1 TsaE [Eubacterium sp.]|nr:tRNA (adenosine(37)-N6)-threonylcarbamoyltransferase complex ATPase subunit type 1 TsaE [Eubacterium sp.]
MKREIVSRSEDDTFLLAEEMGRNAVPGQVFALDGDLGAGKTVFCRGFAEGLGVTELVNSPTFMIVQEYSTGRLPMFHFDVYRIEDPDELDDIGYEEYFRGDGVCLIEWASRIRELLPPDTVFVSLEREMDEGDEYRRITVRRTEQ